MASEKARASERRLKFSSVRRLERQNASPETPGVPARIKPAGRRGSLAAIRDIVPAAYVAVASRVLLALEAVQDRLAARRAVALRNSARAKAASSARSDATSPRMLPTPER